MGLPSREEQRDGTGGVVGVCGLGFTLPPVHVHASPFTQTHWKLLNEPQLECRRISPCWVVMHKLDGGFWLFIFSSVDALYLCLLSTEESTFNWMEGESVSSQDACPWLLGVKSPQPQTEGVSGVYPFEVSLRGRGPSPLPVTVKMATDRPAKGHTNPCS